MKSQHQEQNRKPFDSFATRFRFVRGKRGVSLGALANGKPSTAKSWESGVNPRPDQWEGIASKLGVSVSFLFLGHPKSPGDYAFIAKYADEIAIPSEGTQLTYGQSPGGGGGDLVGEDPAPYGTAEVIRARLERQFRELLDAAGGDVERLGWISVQLAQHLEEPSSWGLNERILGEILAEEERARGPAAKSRPEKFQRDAS